MQTVRLLLVLSMISGGATARADVVMPPPKTCPAGTKPGTCHGGPHCKPEECSSSASCAPGQVCQGQKYCMQTINCGGGYGGPSYVDVARAACAGATPCKVGKCTTVQVCGAKGSVPDGKVVPDTKPPVPDTKPPVPDTKPPTVDTKPPTVDTKPPTVDTKQPVVDTKKPGADTQKPAADSKQPAVDSGGTPAESSSCSCELGTGGGGSWWLLLGLLLWGRRRSR